MLLAPHAGLLALAHRLVLRDVSQARFALRMLLAPHAGLLALAHRLVLRRRHRSLVRGRILEELSRLLQRRLLLAAIRLAQVKVRGDEVAPGLNLLQLHFDGELVRLCFLELLGLLLKLLLLFSQTAAAPPRTAAVLPPRT